MSPWPDGHTAPGIPSGKRLIKYSMERRKVSRTERAQKEIILPFFKLFFEPFRRHDEKDPDGYAGTLENVLIQLLNMIRSLSKSFERANTPSPKRTRFSTLVMMIPVRLKLPESRPERLLAALNIGIK